MSLQHIEKNSENVYIFCVAGLKIEIHAPFKLFIGKGFDKYICAASNYDSSESVRIDVKRMKEVERPKGTLRGTDMLLEYYSSDNNNEIVWCCEAPGKFGAVTRALYTEDFKRISYEINEKSYPRHITSIDKVMQLFPMRQLLFAKKIFLLHSSQAVINGRGILFTGDSGVGKTTQAQLLEKLYQAEITCNDRTAIVKRGDVWRTYGFPIDGSSPINHTGSWKLAAIVVLEQKKNNQISRYSGMSAVKDLMRQMMIDTWNYQMCAEMAWRVIDLLADIPVYRLECTADGRAADCLMEQLRKDGII